MIRVVFLGFCLRLGARSGSLGRALSAILRAPLCVLVASGGCVPGVRRRRPSASLGLRFSCCFSWCLLWAGAVFRPSLPLLFGGGACRRRRLSPSLPRTVTIAALTYRHPDDDDPTQEIWALDVGTSKRLVPMAPRCGMPGRLLCAFRSACFLCFTETDCTEPLSPSSGNPVHLGGTIIKQGTSWKILEGVR